MFAGFPGVEKDLILKFPLVLFKDWKTLYEMILLVNNPPEADKFEII